MQPQRPEMQVKAAGSAKAKKEARQPPLSGLLQRLWRALPKRRRIQYGLLTIVMVFASFAEVFSIGAVLPFLGVLIEPQRVFDHAYAQPFVRALGITSARELLWPLTIVFAAAAVIAGSVRLLLLYLNTRLSAETGADLSKEIYRRTLHQPYTVHIARNSSQVIAGITQQTTVVIFQVLIPMVNMVGAGFMLVMIMATLLWIDAEVALGAFAGFGVIYLMVIVFTRRRLVRNSVHIARESGNVTKVIQEGLGGIRDVLLDGTQDTYCQIYQTADHRLRRAQSNNAFIGGSPRFGAEALGMVLISGLAYAMAKGSHSLGDAIPVLGALALGAQRMLPMLQQCYLSWSNIKGSQAPLAAALDLLEQPAPSGFAARVIAPLPFSSALELHDVGFSYQPDAPLVLSNIDLTVRKGERVGIMGSTGSGKSTLVDIVMGLLHPSEGRLMVDGCAVEGQSLGAWQRRIAHVPQTIFLADASILENVAFGVPRSRIDIDRVKTAIRQAQLSDMVETLSDQYETFVGERGVRLSGGQRQRIGIARALYKQADVIVFDEATSALDNETEKAVMDAIGGLSQDLTILLIAHRLSTLASCDRIVELDRGRVVRVGTYQDLVLAPPVEGGSRANSRI